MSKSRPSTEVKKVAVGSTRKERSLKHLTAIAKATAARVKELSPAMWALLILAGAFAIFAPVGLAAKAMLYLIADNGKKSGRASGNVYMRNGRTRGFVVPSLVQNLYTTRARALLAQLSQGWSALTDADRLSWNQIDWLFKSDRFGNPKLVKGKAAYVMLNCNLINIGSTPITVAPLSSDGVSGITDITSIIPDQSTGFLDMTYTPTPVDAGVNILVFATAPTSAGVSRPSLSRFRLIDFISGTDTSPKALAAPYTLKYGAAWSSDAGYVGGKIHILLKPINILTGVEGGNIIGTGTIQA